MADDSYRSGRSFFVPASQLRTNRLSLLRGELTWFPERARYHCLQPSMPCSRARRIDDRIEAMPIGIAAMIQPKTIRWFLILAEEGDLKRSAKRCGVTQRAFRQEMAQLESIQGSALYQVTGRRLDLTEAGFQLRSRLISEPGAEKNSLRIMHDPVSGPTTPSWISATARQFFPDLHVRFIEGVPGQQIGQVQTGQVDLSLMYGFPDDLAGKKLAYQFLHAEPVMALLSRQHRFATALQLRWQDLSGESWILPSRHRMPYIHDTFSWEVQRAGFKPIRLSRVPKAPLIDILASGAAISLAPLSFLLQCPPAIAGIPLDPPLSVPFGAVFQPGHASKGVMQLLDLLKRITSTQRPAVDKQNFLAFRYSVSTSSGSAACLEPEMVCAD